MKKILLVVSLILSNLIAEPSVKELKNMCNSGDVSSCAKLGDNYSDGKGVKQNYKQAFKFYKKSCDGGNTTACYNLGAMYYSGQGVKQNFKIAKKYSKKACDLGEQKGCSNYVIIDMQDH